MPKREIRTGADIGFHYGTMNQPPKPTGSSKDINLVPVELKVVSDSQAGKPQGANEKAQ